VSRSDLVLTSKIDSELRKRLEAGEPQQDVPVIVTLSGSANRALLENTGLTVLRNFDNIPAIAGTLPLARIKELAQLEQVERIEYDNQAQEFTR
jgi:hypothetical protein